MPIETPSDVPLLARLDAALLRRTAAGLVARPGEYGDLFVEEVSQAEIRRDGLEPGFVVTGRGGGAAVRVLSAPGQRHAAVDGLDPGRIAELPLLVREESERPATDAPPGRASPARQPASPGGRPVPTGGGPVSFPDPAQVDALAVYVEALTAAIGAIPQVARDAGTRAAAARDSGPAVRLRAELRVQRVAIASSEGDVVEDRRAWARFTVRIAVVGRGGRLLEAAAGGGARDPARLATLRAPQAVVEDLRQALEEAEHAAPAPTGVLPVVLGPGVGGLLFHEACGHGLEGDRAMRGRSAFANLVGEAVGPETLTLVDDPTLDGLSGSRRFDDEGWPSAPLVLIDAGRIAGLMLDRATALRARTAPTGGARRESYRDLPLPRMTNTFVREGPHDPEEIVRSLPRGLYVAELGRGQVDTASADFAFDVRRGYLIAGGRRVAPAGPCRIEGNGVRAVEAVTMIGSDLRFDSGSGECGKEGQRARAAVGQPTLLVGGLSVVSDGR
jgi:predicted Zn-dependent protease